MSEEKPIAIVAEDEELIAKFMQRMLDNDYNVKVVGSAAAAKAEIDALKAAGQEVALLLSDNGLTDGQTGPKLISHARKAYQKLPVVAVSGGDQERFAGAIDAAGVPVATVQLLPKPFATREFFESIDTAKEKAAAISTAHRDQLGGGDRGRELS